MQYSIGTRMQLFRKAKGLSVKTMAALLNMSDAKLRNLENNETTITEEIAYKFAGVVNTTVYNLVGPYSHTAIEEYNTSCLPDGQCICGFHFKWHINNDLDEDHVELHERFLRFSEEFGYQSASDSAVHNSFHEAINPETALTIDERLNAVEEYVKWYYLRSASVVAKEFWNKHPKYPDYMAMRLNQQTPNFLRKLPFNMYQILVDKYGTQEGIKDGSSYFKVN